MLHQFPPNPLHTVHVINQIHNTDTAYLDILSFEVRNWISESATHIHRTQRHHVLGYNLVTQTDPIIVLQTNVRTDHQLNKAFHIQCNIIKKISL